MEEVYRQWGELFITTDKFQELMNFLENEGYNSNEIEIKGNITTLEYKMVDSISDHFDDLELFISKLTEIDKKINVEGKIILDYQYPEYEDEDYDIDDGDFIYLVVENNKVTEEE